MIKVITVVGTRPEIIKLAPTIKELDKNFNHILVNTNQNSDFELNKIFFKQFKIREPNYNFKLDNKTQTSSISEILFKIEKVLINEKPDAFLVYGDTNTGLSAIAAKNLKIPIFHMEAGNRCYDQRVPEEVNRKIIDHISDLNMVISDQAKINLLNEGINQEFILKTGSHMEEVFLHYEQEIQSNKILNKLNLKKKNFFVVSLHRAETVDIDKNLIEILSSLNELHNEYKIPMVISCHPRTKKRLDMIKFKLHKKIKLYKPFNFFEYTKLQKESFCVLSDSGSVFEESFLNNFAALSIRKSHERIEGIEDGSIIMSGLKLKNIISSINLVTKNKNYKKNSDYFGGKVSYKICKYILSYIDKINEKIWLKKN
jgi:UDP-N-acetylglucosamine 2-epimerase (non-hydrolysing)